MNTRDSLLPSKLEVILYAVLSVFVAFVGSLRFLTDYLLRETDFGFDTLRSQASQNTGDILRFIDELSFTPATAVFVFWSIVGIIAFSAGQAIINSYIEFKRDVDISTKFLHPKRFANSQFWLDLILQTVAHMSLYVMVLMWSALLGFVFVPLTAGVTQGAVLDPSTISIGSLISMIVLLTIGILVEAMLIKLLFRRKQLVL